MSTLVSPNCSLALPAEKQKRHECHEKHCDVFVAAPAPSCAVIVWRQTPVIIDGSAVVRWLAAGRALHQRHLVGGGPFLRPVWARAVAGTLAIVE